MRRMRRVTQCMISCGIMRKLVFYQVRTQYQKIFTRESTRRRVEVVTKISLDELEECLQLGESNKCKLGDEESKEVIEENIEEEELV